MNNIEPFLRRARGVARLLLFLSLASLVLAACANGAEDDDPAEDLNGTAADTVDGVELTFVGWEGYDGTPAGGFPAFREWWDEHSITLSSTYVSTNEEMLTGIQTAPTGTYDLTSPYHGTVPTMILAGVLEPIDVDRLSNWPSVYEFLREQDFIRGSDGEIYAIPFTFSQNVALYNADRVEPLERFSEIFDNPDLEGRFAMLDAPEQLTWIAVHLGYGNPDPHHLTQEELAEVGELAREAVSKARTLAPAHGDLLQLLVAGDVDYIWGGTRDMVATAQAEGVNAQIFLPAEGTQMFVDVFAIPAGSEHVDAAHAWIDQALSPEVQAELAAVFGGGVANPDAVTHLDEQQREIYNYDDIEAEFGRTPVLPPIPAESDEFATISDWIRTWDEAK